MFLILLIIILEGYFLYNRTIFDFVDKLLPVSNMAFFMSEENVRLHNFVHLKGVSENVNL